MIRSLSRSSIVSFGLFAPPVQREPNATTAGPKARPAGVCRLLGFAKKC